MVSWTVEASILYNPDLKFIDAAKSDWSVVHRVAVDETSARRGRRYVTNVLDAANSRLLLMVEGRGVQALGAFAEALRQHGGDPFRSRQSRWI